jgi:hypothetical protein
MKQRFPEADTDDLAGMRGLASVTGLRCRHCGCLHFTTLQTTKDTERVVRRRECRNCGWRCITSETFTAEVQKRMTPVSIPVVDDPDDFLT